MQLKAESITFQYNKKSGHALDNVSFSFESGERVGRDEKGPGLGVGRLPTRQGFSREKALWVMRFRLGKIK